MKFQHADAYMQLIPETADESSPWATENGQEGLVINMLSSQLLCLNELG
ncbi:MAG: hypothetical protein MR536_07820 [Prevotella sp.]|nr:hypothetical protein [Prevotella sp.]MDD7462502.1 hypothetical protein [Prevotellaceae bacterium]MDY3366173.1 hypothetical protein [Prevotella sp.]MDY3853033.1 hypothetical protein [Prevotella sp.]